MTDVLCPVCQAPMYYASRMISRSGYWRHYECPRRCCNLELPFTDADMTQYRAENAARYGTDSTVTEPREPRPLWRRLLGV